MTTTTQKTTMTDKDGFETQTCGRCHGSFLVLDEREVDQYAATLSSTSQGQGQGQGPAGPCAHVVRVVDTHPMAPGPGWDLVACERCKAVGHRARAWGGRDPGEVTWPGIGPAAPSAAEPTPQMEEPTDA